MSTAMEDEIKRWIAKRKSALVMELLQGKTTVAAGVFGKRLKEDPISRTPAATRMTSTSDCLTATSTSQLVVL